MSILNALLSKIPGNGYKTSLGAVLALVSAATAMLQSADGQSLLNVLMTRPIDWAAVSVLVVGLVHKYVKAKDAQE